MPLSYFLKHSAIGECEHVQCHQTLVLIFDACSGEWYHATCINMTQELHVYFNWWSDWSWLYILLLYASANLNTET